MRNTLLFSVFCVLLSILSAPPAYAIETGEVLAKELLGKRTGDFDMMREAGVVRVLVPYSKTFYFIDRGKIRGLTAELLREFEININKKRKKNERITVVVIPTPRDRLLSDLVEGQGDIAIGNLTITQEREKLVAFSDPMLEKVRELVVTPKSTPAFESLADLSGKTIHVRKSSSYFETLTAVNKRLREEKSKPIKIKEADEFLEDEDLIEMVQANMLPAILVDSHKIEFWKKVFPDIVVHGNIPLREGGRIAWAFRKDSPLLAAEVNRFVQIANAKSSIGATLMRRYLKSTKWLDGAKLAADKDKIGKLEKLFRQYGEQYRIDWRILAAISYQESNFDQSKRNPSGAVGLMQIKPSTAADPNIGIKDIEKDPDKNVHAGTKYIRFIADEYFAEEEIDDFNRILLTLAAYNAGPNRVARERKKAEKPHVWFGQVEWAVAKRAGYEPVKYVSNIYKYFIFFRGVDEGADKAGSVKTPKQ